MGPHPGGLVLVPELSLSRCCTGNNEGGKRRWDPSNRGHGISKGKEACNPTVYWDGGMKQAIQGCHRAQDRRGIGNQVETLLRTRQWKAQSQSWVEQGPEDFKQVNISGLTNILTALWELSVIRI